MIIDCDDCAMRDLACDDCVVSVLLGPARTLGSAERTALAVLADGGLVPPLRMMPTKGVASGRRATRRVGGGRPGGSSASA